MQSDSFILEDFNANNIKDEIEYLTDSTDDKVYLLSKSEVLDLSNFRNRTERIRNCTNYATANGASNWWCLRSSFFSWWDWYDYVYIVDGDGNCDCVDCDGYQKDYYDYEICNNEGVVPAITVYLPD